MTKQVQNPTMAPSNSPAAGAHILLVDDDIDLTAMLRQYLENEGFQVTVDFNGLQAAGSAISGTYDAVLLDVMLPMVTGIELLRKIRRVSNIPVIMLTAKGDQVDRVIGLELGADDYVPKPYYAPELVARLRAVLRRRHGNSMSSEDNDDLVLSDLRVSVPARRAMWGEVSVSLTITEFNLLVALLQSGDRVATREHLCRSVLGRPWESYDRSIDVHANNLRQKLLSATDGGLEIETVRGIGYRLKARS